MQLQDVAEHVLPTPKIKDRAARGPGAGGGPDLGEAVSLLNSPTSSDGTGVGIGRRRDSTLRGQVDDLETVLPTPRTGSNRNSRKGLVPQGHNHWAAPALEQVAELIDGELPREYEDESEVKGAARALLPTPSMMRGRHNGDGDAMLHGAVEELLPTPAAARAGDTPEAHLRKKPGRTTVTNLEVMATGGMLPTPRATDGTNGGPNQRGSAGDLALPSAALSLTPTPSTEQRGSDLPDRQGGPSLTQTARDLPTPTTPLGGRRTRGADRSDELLLDGVVQEYQMSWGPYEAAICRWERVLGRAAPWATEPAPRSKKGRLAPRFVEWMMGWAEGWVTAIPGLSRNAQLKILGNGVVPQQAEAAVRFLLEPPAHREPPKRKVDLGRRPKTAKAWMRAAG